MIRPSSPLLAQPRSLRSHIDVLMIIRAFEPHSDIDGMVSKARLVTAGQHRMPSKHVPDC